MKQSPLKRTTALKSDPAKTRAFIQRGRANSTRKRQPVSPASPAQRAAVHGKRCVNCAHLAVDPAHIIDRSLLSDGQEDVLAVVPLCRVCHDLYDSGKLDLLPVLELPEYRRHLAFAVLRFGLLKTLHRVTGARWVEAA